jgi:hypothetical protein
MNDRKFWLCVLGVVAISMGVLQLFRTTQFLSARKSLVIERIDLVGKAIGTKAGRVYVRIHGAVLILFGLIALVGAFG